MARLVLSGRGYNEYYNVDGRYIREGLEENRGRCTDYEFYNNEIWYRKDGQWKTMAVISGYGSGNVMYLNDYYGDKPFERYEWR